MIRVATVALALMLAASTAALGAQFLTLFPPSANHVASVTPSSSIDGVNHLHLGINLVNLDLFAVLMGPSGVPTVTLQYPWLYGNVVSVVQTHHNVYRVTWSVSVSSGGISAAWYHAGLIFVDFVV
jgi:hypothetical protein